MKIDHANKKFHFVNQQDTSHTLELPYSQGLLYLLAASNIELETTSTAPDYVKAGLITRNDYENYKKYLDYLTSKKGDVNKRKGDFIDKRRNILEQQIDQNLVLQGKGIKSDKKKKSFRTLYTGKAPLQVQSGSGIKYARGQDDLTRFEVLGGTIAGGNNNPDLRNSFLELADSLYENKKIKKSEHKKAYQTAGITV